MGSKKKKKGKSKEKTKPNKAAPETERPFHQVGVIPYKKTIFTTKVMLITSSSNALIFPKGNLQTGSSPEESALNEGWEEAGVRGTIEKKWNCVYTHIKDGTPLQVKLFPLAVKELHGSWPEADSRKRYWVTLAAARQRVGEKGLLSALDEFEEWLYS